MENKTIGIVLSVKKQWWLKINTKPVRIGGNCGAVFPHIVKVKYTVDGKDYVKRKWLGAGKSCPEVSERVTVIYLEDRPEKFRLDI